MKEDTIFQLVELLDGASEEEIVAQAIELIKQDTDLVEKLVYDAAINSLNEAQQIKPLVEAYKSFAQQQKTLN